MPPLNHFNMKLIIMRQMSAPLLPWDGFQLIALALLSVWPIYLLRAKAPSPNALWFPMYLGFLLELIIRWALWNSTILLCLPAVPNAQTMLIARTPLVCTKLEQPCGFAPISLEQTLVFSKNLTSDINFEFYFIKLGWWYVYRANREEKFYSRNFYRHILV